MSTPTKARAAAPGWLDRELLYEIIAHRRQDLDTRQRAQLEREVETLIDRGIAAEPADYWHADERMWMAEEMEGLGLAAAG
jgi:hypothetical protein